VRSSIPLVDIVDSFDVFHTGQGSQGILARPSKQELETVFETTKEDEIVEIILTKGQIKSSDTPHQWTGKNDSKCVPPPPRRRLSPALTLVLSFPRAGAAATRPRSAAASRATAAAGKHLVSQIVKVRRPLSFLGSRSLGPSS